MLFWPSWREISVTLRPCGDDETGSERAAAAAKAAAERCERDQEQGTTPG